MIEICAVGGYNEVGKNMTAVKVDSEAVILDMGIHLEPYIKATEEEDIVKISSEELTAVGAIPNIKRVEDWRKRVKLIVLSHAHLDHIGAVPYLAGKFNAPILCTPFSMQVVRTILSDEKIRIKNKIKALNVNSFYKLSNKLMVEFINVTHSTPQTVMIALHTPAGVILYANDFKFDLFPTLGQKPNFEKLAELGKRGVLALIVDSTYASLAQKMPSESVAKQMLKDVLLGTDNSGKAIIVTTFSSHIARLKSVIEFGKKLNRKIVFLGRSLAKYSKAAQAVGIVNFSEEAEIVKYGRQVKGKLKKIVRAGKEKYLLVVTGHQGEPKSTLSKMINQELKFRFDPGDSVIFSCKTIPTPTNKRNREVIEKKLRQLGVRLFTDIHTSGHAAREDLRDLIKLVKPKHIIPAHGELKMLAAMKELAAELGYSPGRSVHLLSNGQRIVLD
jgi:ribonuclease J